VPRCPKWAPWCLSPRTRAPRCPESGTAVPQQGTAVPETGTAVPLRFQYT
ncbi:hypothetical protein TorRG33x02_267350, partial [Trema orientale]